MERFVPTNATFTDAEAIVGTIIRSASTAAGSRVYSSIPANPSYPLAVVQRIGGLPLHRNAIDQAEIQVDIWAESKSAARSLADQARVALMAAEGTTVTAGANVGFVYDISPSLGLTWAPDPANTTKERYIFGVRVTLRDVAA